MPLLAYDDFTKLWSTTTFRDAREGKPIQRMSQHLGRNGECDTRLASDVCLSIMLLAALALDIGARLDLADPNYSPPQSKEY